MKKIYKILLITLLVLIIVIAGILFTQTGNDLVKPYLKAELEKQIGLPVEVDTFKLRYDHTLLKLVIDKGLKVDVASAFNLLTQSFDGTYKVGAKNFIYEGLSLDQANINGEFKGVPDDLRVNGKGTSFNAPLTYDLRVVEGEAQEITFYIKALKLSDIFALAKQPALAKGLVEANLTIPTLVKDKLAADVNINLSDVTFNDALMKKIYNISLPEAFLLQGNIDAKMREKNVIGSVTMQSDIADVNLSAVNVDMQSKHISAEYLINILDLKSLSSLLHTKVDGLLVLKGKVEKTDTLKVTGSTDSLGGKVKYALANKDFTAKLSAMPMQNMLKMFQFPAFIDANTTGELHYNLATKQGHSALALADFKLASNKVTQSLGAVMPINPTDIIFGETSFDANISGDEVIYTLIAKASEASITIGEGRINKEKDTHEAKMEFGFNKYAIAGSIGGSIRKPRIGFDTKGFLKDQMLENNFLERAEDKVKKFFKRLF